jgi:pimeloyl-ACP methyl ester carboxylesterase
VQDTAFGQGFAYGYSAYSKDGYAVENGVKHTQSLKKLVDRIGNHRAYIIGESMCGNVALALVEKYEDDYVGALPFCGVVSGWYEQVRYLADFRVVYDFYTLGIPDFQLKAFDGTIGDPLKPVTDTEAVTKVATLFGAAQAGNLLALNLIQQISVAAGITPEPVSYITALLGASIGFADLIQTAGGIGYSNLKTSYAGGPNLFGVPINSGIYRLAVDNPKAVTYLNNWYTPKGNFEAKVLSVHNTVDPLVPYSHELTLKAKVQAQHNSSRFVVQDVNPGAFSFNPYADPNTWSPKHCDFKPSQMVFAWNELKNWVEKGIKPTEMNITTK